MPHSLISEPNFFSVRFNIIRAFEAKARQTQPSYRVDNADPIAYLAEVMAEREINLIREINDVARAQNILTAEGDSLDLLVANVGLTRGDNETDGELRARYFAVWTSLARESHDFVQNRIALLPNAGTPLVGLHYDITENANTVFVFPYRGGSFPRAYPDDFLTTVQDDLSQANEKSVWLNYRVLQPQTITVRVQGVTWTARDSGNFPTLSSQWNSALSSIRGRTDIFGPNKPLLLADIKPLLIDYLESVDFDYGDALTIEVSNFTEPTEFPDSWDDEPTYSVTTPLLVDNTNNNSIFKRDPGIVYRLASGSTRGERYGS